jgi:hypothetical protein
MPYTVRVDKPIPSSRGCCSRRSAGPRAKKDRVEATRPAEGNGASGMVKKLKDAVT